MKPGWRYTGIALAVISILIVVVYLQTVVYLMKIWGDISVGEYGHGYLVLAISFYLVMVNRKRLLSIAPCPSYAILPLVLLASLFWLSALIVDVEVLQTVGLLLVILASAWTIVGHKAIKILAFPILFISFAIPIWFPLSPLLQDLTADVVFWITRFIEVPAFREENLIVLPAGTFAIEEPCSGLRYLLAALTLGSLYGYMNYVTLPARIAVVLVAAAVAILANILRVFVVVYMGYITDMQHPWVHDHLMLGWYIFGGLVAVMLFLDSRFYRHAETTETQVVSDESRTVQCDKGGLHLLVISVVCTVLLMSGPIVVYLTENQSYPSASDYSLILPTGTEGWAGPGESSNNWMPIYKGSISQKMDYQKQSDVVSLYVGYYPRQKQGEEVVNVMNRISHKKVWRKKYAHAYDRQLTGYHVKEQLLENSRFNKRLVWYWYDIGGRVTSNKYEAKVLQLVSMVTGKTHAKVLAISVEIKEDVSVARQSLSDFATDMKLPLANIQAIEK